MSTHVLRKLTSNLTRITKMEHFGDFIAQRREEIGLSQRELADKAGVTHAVISRIESGQSTEFKFSTFLGMSKALKLHPMELIAVYEGKPFPETAKPTPEAQDEAILEAFREFLSVRKEPK